MTPTGLNGLQRVRGWSEADQRSPIWLPIWMLAASFIAKISHENNSDMKLSNRESTLDFSFSMNQVIVSAWFNSENKQLAEYCVEIWRLPALLPPYIII